MRESFTGFISDKLCTVKTPVTYGGEDKAIYGKNISIRPRLSGREDTPHMQSVLLAKLLPLEEYDFIAVLMSGGKDSVACYYKLLELGVPKNKIEFWHHDIDGGHPYRKMDWRCTQNYVEALAKAEGVPLRTSWRVNGFFGELYRIGASEPVEWKEPATGEVRRCRLTYKYRQCQKIKKTVTENLQKQLMEYGFRMKFPMKSSDLSVRWCSSYLKIAVAEAIMSNLDRLGELDRMARQNNKSATETGPKKCKKKILIVSGERRGESVGRSVYNEMEVHRTNAILRANRLVHHWRPVIDYSEKDVWEVLRRHKVNPHPCYRAGWNRCSCAMCIFSTPKLFAGIRELYPEEFRLLQEDEKILGFTLDNKCDLETYIGTTESCLYRKDREAIHSLITGEFLPKDIYVSGEWMYPAGAFHGAEGGPC